MEGVQAFRLRVRELVSLSLSPPSFRQRGRLLDFAELSADVTPRTRERDDQ